MVYVPSKNRTDFINPVIPLLPLSHLPTSTLSPVRGARNQIRPNSIMIEFAAMLPISSSGFHHNRRPESPVGIAGRNCRFRPIGIIYGRQRIYETECFIATEAKTIGRHLFIIWPVSY